MSFAVGQDGEIRTDRCRGISARLNALGCRGHRTQSGDQRRYERQAVSHGSKVFRQAGTGEAQLTGRPWTDLLTVRRVPI